MVCRIGFLKDFEESCITQSSIGINKILDDNQFKRKGFIVAQGFRGVSWCKSKSFTLFPPALRQGRTSEPGVSHREQSCLSWGSWKGRQERGLETTYTLQPTPSMTHFLQAGLVSESLQAEVPPSWEANPLESHEGLGDVPDANLTKPLTLEVTHNESWMGRCSMEWSHTDLTMSLSVVL